MKKNTILIPLTAVTLAMPALADPVTPNIAVGTNPADCNETVLETTSGTSNLEANWNANTLNLQWTAPDADNWSAQNNTCTYDSGITVPQTNPTKTGYTFAGWHVKTAVAPAQTSFNLSTLDATIGGLSYNSKNFADNWCYYYNEDTGDEIDSETCNESVFSGLTNGEWTTEFSYGTVGGIAYCSGKSGNNHSWEWGGNSADWTATESELSSAGGEKMYCWCKATNYTPLNGSKQSVSSSSWVSGSDGGNADGCARSCAFLCASDVQRNDAFRRAVFGVTQ